MPSYPAEEEADRLNRIALMEMTLCIYVNTPPEPRLFKLASGTLGDL